MANGKGTISCFYCEHYVRTTQPLCNLYNAELPLDDVGSDNPLCADFSESSESETLFGMQRQLAELSPHMQRGYLYAYPYPSHDRPRELRQITKLSPYV